TRPGRPRLDAQLLEEAARLPRPGEREVPLRPRDAHVQQPPLLRERARYAERLLARQLLLLDARDEDGVELEPLRAVQRQQVDAARGPVVEPGPQPRDPLVDGPRSVVELVSELAEPPQVGLPHELPLPDALRHRLDETLLARHAPHLARQRPEPRTPQALQE